MTSVALAMRPAALIRGATRNATWPRWELRRGEPGDIQQRAEPMVLDLAQTVQAALDDNPVLAG